MIRVLSGMKGMDRVDKGLHWKKGGHINQHLTVACDF